MNTDLELYRVFCEVVKYKNISKAAENMYISQSAVTQSIQKLENLLGGKVFYRNKNGVELTDEGSNLYEYIKDSIATMNNAEKIFSKYINLEKGRIRIGGGNALINYLILKPLVKFMKQYPQIKISIVNGMTDTLVQRLSNGDLDIVVLNLPFNEKKYSNVEITPLKKSVYSFFASKRYANENDVTDFSQIDEHTLILPKKQSSKRIILDNFCEKENLKLSCRYEVSSSSVMKNMVLNDVGVGFTNNEIIKDVSDEIVIIKNIESDINAEGIATLTKNMTNKATAELVKMIKEHYKQNL